MNERLTRTLHVLLAVLVALMGVVPTPALLATGGANTAQSEEAIDPGDWHQGHVSLAIDDAGTRYAVWQDYRDGTVPHIRFATRPATGSWGTSVKVDAAGAGDQNYPVIGVDGTGNACVVWQDERGSVLQIRYATRPAGGSWSASQVISPTAQAQYRPALAVNGSGVAVAAWHQGAYPTRDVFAAIRPAGGPWGPVGRVNDVSTGDQHTPAVALDDAGQAYAVWTDERNGDRDIYFAARPAGGPWSANERVDDDASGQWQYEPDVAVAADGTAHAVWRDLRGGNWSIYHATRPAGGPWSANVPVNDDATGGREQPAVAVDELGNALAVWIDNRNGTGGDLYGATRPPGGPWAANELLVPAPTAKDSAPPDETSDVANPSRETSKGKGSIVYSKGTSSDPYKHKVYEIPADSGEELDHIVVTGPETVEAGGSAQFVATGYDADNKPLPGLTFNWSATGGSITQGGEYTAGTLPGYYQVIAAVGKVVGSARVRTTGDDRPDLEPGYVETMTLPTKGIYPYYDAYNHDLRGTVVVNPATANSEYSEGQSAVVTVPVTITAAGFDPPTVTITVSDTVCWTNADTTVHAIRGGVPYELFLPLVMKNH